MMTCPALDVPVKTRVLRNCQKLVYGRLRTDPHDVTANMAAVS